MINVVQCNLNDILSLSQMNKQLIEDEKSENSMSVEELAHRMENFLLGEYEAFFFQREKEIVGYALVKKDVNPVYLRQFFIKREWRKQHLGTEAFAKLKEHLGTEQIDLEVLSHNEAGKIFWEKCGFREYSRYMKKTQ